MPHAHGFQGRDTRTNEFTSAGKAGHQVRLDQADRDLQISGHVTRVEPDRDTARGVSEVGVLGENLTVMVFDPVVLGNVSPDHLDQFIPFVRPVETGGDEDQDLFAGYALRFECL